VMSSPSNPRSTRIWASRSTRKPLSDLPSFVVTEKRWKPSRI